MEGGGVGRTPGNLDFNVPWHHDSVELAVQTLVDRLFRYPATYPAGAYSTRGGAGAAATTTTTEEQVAVLRRTESVFGSNDCDGSSLLTTTVMPSQTASLPQAQQSKKIHPPRQEILHTSMLSYSAYESFLVRGRRLVDGMVPTLARQTAGRVFRITPWSYNANTAAGNDDLKMCDASEPVDIDWERVRLGFTKIAIANNERMQADSGDQSNMHRVSAAFQREELIGGVAQLLDALPRKLTVAEEGRLRESLPRCLKCDGICPRTLDDQEREWDRQNGGSRSGTLVPARATGERAMTTTRSNRAAQGSRELAGPSSSRIATQQPNLRTVQARNKQKRRSILFCLRDVVSWTVTWFFMIGSIILPYLAALLTAAIRYERRNRLIARTVRGTLRMNRDLARWVASAYLTGDRTVGDVVSLGIEWTVRAVADGMTEGLSNGMEVVKGAEWEQDDSSDGDRDDGGEEYEVRQERRVGAWV